jgi:hypothetical protein
MKTPLCGQVKPALGSLTVPVPSSVLQRKCACGSTPGPTGECATCRRQRLAAQRGSQLQTELAISRPGDRYEREADHVAEQVMRIPEPRQQRLEIPEARQEGVPVQIQSPARVTPTLVQRQANLEEEEEVILQAKMPDGQVPEMTSTVATDVQAVIQSGGQSLPPSVRSMFEYRFGHDLKQVRIHTDRQAAATANTIHARAFTLGNHIVFGPNQYAPGTGIGDRLIAHELTHVLQQNEPNPLVSVGGLQRIRPQASPKRIQRAVSYTGALIQQDIDPVQPNTAPAGNPTAVGHTAFLVNGTDVQSLSAPQDKIDLLFPLPGFATIGGNCFMTNKNINMTVQNRVRILTPRPWTRTIAKSHLNTLFGGTLGSPSACNGPGNTTVDVQGAPTDLALRAWVLQGEMQHARDDACLVDRYLKSYEADVRGLPNQFPRGYLGFGSCAARLDERLKRTERAQAFFRDWQSWAQTYDGPGGSHQIVARSRIAAGCNTVTLTVNTGPLPAASRACSAWSPP